MREKTDTISNAPMPPKSNHKRLWITVGVVLVIALRFIVLDSDPYSRLSWSGGLLTDEGFYLTNARNRVLFGQERLDGWNNAVIMPTLNLLQKGAFGVFGVGRVQARLISVVLSLLTLGFFFDALRRAFNLRVAWFGVVFLGFDHTVLLYHRMALMDTPGAFVLTLAFWAFVRGTTPSPPNLLSQTRLGRGGESGLNLPAPSEERAKRGEGAGVRAHPFWLLGCGVLMGLAYATRGLALLIFPVPLWVLWRQNWRLCGAYAAGLALFFCVYVPVWYLPNRAEIGHIGRFYLDVQMLPHSLTTLRLNIARMLWGERGGNVFFLRHSPVIWLAAGFATLRLRRDQATLQFLRLWLLCFLAVFTSVSYAPSRYYVLFAPALMALAAISIDHALDIIRWRRFATAACVVWGVVNAGWMTHWLLTLRWTQRDTEQWLVANLPADSVLIGDAAPALTINTGLRAVNVQPGLCNDTQPFEKFAGKPRYLVMIDEGNNFRWLEGQYPHRFTPAYRVKFFPDVMGFGVVVYRFPE